jgi:hypothetical protein
LTDVDHTWQRRTWWPAPRLGRLNTLAKAALATAAVLVVAVLGYNMLPDNRPGGRPTPSPTPTPSPLPTPGDVVLGAGGYSLANFPVGVTFEVPDGWIPCSLSVLEQAVCYEVVAPSISVSFAIVVGVVADPCGAADELVSPAVGPSVDDLVEAISGLESFTVSAPTEIGVDGFAGVEITVTAPGLAACDLKTWATATRVNGVSAREINVMRIFDVRGTRVVISGAYQPGDPSAAEGLAAIQSILASVHFRP